MNLSISINYDNISERNLFSKKWKVGKVPSYSESWSCLHEVE
jgi:hypothetical protein